VRKERGGGFNFYRPEYARMNAYTLICGILAICTVIVLLAFALGVELGRGVERRRLSADGVGGASGP
jgi:hypothetical protein